MLVLGEMGLGYRKENGFYFKNNIAKVFETRNFARFFLSIAGMKINLVFHFQ